MTDQPAAVTDTAIRAAARADLEAICHIARLDPLDVLDDLIEGFRARHLPAARRPRTAGDDT